MTVPIATSPGRSGSGPQLSRWYDSGAAHGMASGRVSSATLGTGDVVA
jgi:hypothetical protein